MSLYKLVTVNWASLKAEARVLPTGYQCPEITPPAFWPATCAPPDERTKLSLETAIT